VPSLPFLEVIMRAQTVSFQRDGMPVVYDAERKKDDSAAVGTDEVAVTTPSTTSQGVLLLPSDPRQARVEAQLPSKPASERPPLMRLILFMPGHTAAIDAQKPIMEDPRKYGQYLLNLRHDLALLEAGMDAHSVSLPSLPVLVRTPALDKDIAHLGAEGDVSPLVKTYDHADYFRSIASEPAKLAAHLYVHYLGFLFGGQGLATDITRKWGEEAAHLYRFDADPTALRTSSMSELGAYVQAMTEGEFAAFQNEVPIAWTFTCDLLDRDIRTRTV
jgi:hypothetical protein